MAVGSKLLYKRQGALDLVTNSVLAPATSRSVQVLPRGAQVNGSQAAVTSITIHAGHGLTTGCKFMVNTDTTKFYTAGTVTATSTGTLGSSATATVTDGDVLVNLGSDTGSTSPNFDDATVPIYSSVSSGTALTQSEVTSNATTGKYEYWSTERLVWELVLVAGSPNTIIRDIELWRAEEVFRLKEVDGGPSTAPTSGSEVQMYMKSDAFIWKFDDSGTTRYKYFRLNGTAISFAHSTSEPT